MIDMLAGARGPSTTMDLGRLQTLKTGALIVCAAESGAVLGKAPASSARAAGLGRDIGLAYQIADDLLDARASAAETGKAAGKDAAAGKATLVTLLGVDRARRRPNAWSAQAKDHLRLRPAGDILRPRADFVVERERARDDSPPPRRSSTGSLPADTAQGLDRQLASWPTSCGPRPSTRCRQTGGHLGAGLGVVELTVALHAVFKTPRDRLIWDVGHQAYPHKILTGRRDRIRTLRQAAASPASPGGPRANTTPSAPRIPAPRSPPASAWPSPAT